MYQNQTLKVDKVKCKAPLSGYEYTPDRPDGLSDQYTFRGWYQDPTLTTPADFSGTMPLGNLTLYAKFALPNVQVEFYEETPENGGALLSDKTQIVTMESTLDSVMSDAEGNLTEEFTLTRTADGKTEGFEGWYYRDASGTEHKFIPSMQVPGSIAYTAYDPKPEDVEAPQGVVKIYAKWKVTEEPETGYIRMHITFDKDKDRYYQTVKDEDGNPILFSIGMLSGAFFGADHGLRLETAPFLSEMKTGKPAFAQVSPFFQIILISAPQRITLLCNFARGQRISPSEGGFRCRRL